MCMWKCIIKMINIKRYKQNCDNVTCNIKVETEIDFHSDTKQAVKWQVLRHVTEYNTNKTNTINVSDFWTLGGSWIVILSLPSWVHYHSTGPSLDALWASVPLYISLHVHVVPNVLLQSLCGWPRKSLHPLEEAQNHPIVHFAYLRHMLRGEFVFLSSLYIKLLALGVEVAFNNKSAVTHHKVDMFKFPLRSSCSERTNDAFVLLICSCLVHR